MPSTLGYLWGTGETPSVARMDARTIFSGSGSDIAAIPSGYEVPVARCIQTAGAYDVDTIWYRSADGLSWLPFMPTHTHNDTSAKSGGLLKDCFGANMAKLATIYEMFPTIERFYRDTSAGGTAINNYVAATDYNLKLDSSTTANNAINLIAGGTKIDFAQKAYISTKMQISHNIDILWRAGIGMERAQAVSDNTRKVGIEGCSGDGVNIQIVSCDGITRTKISSGANMAQGQSRGYKLIYTPATSLIYSDSVGNSVTKNTNIPSSGTTGAYNPYVLGIKTTNTTAKQLYLWNLQVFAGLGDPDQAL